MSPELEIELLDSTPSTMDDARSRIADGRFRPSRTSLSLACVLAREQTAGRGQRGRAWFAPPGETLCATYLLHCEGVTDPPVSSQLGLLAGVAVVEALERVGVRAGIGLKWPNDVMLNGRKTGGILVEMTRSPDGPWVALVGVGINLSVRTFPPEIADLATSLLLEDPALAERVAAVPLAREIGGCLTAWAPACLAEPARVIEAWRRADATTGRRYEALLKGVPEVGTAVGIDDSGALLLRTNDGDLVAVTSASSLRDLPPRPS